MNISSLEEPLLMASKDYGYHSVTWRPLAAQLNAIVTRYSAIILIEDQLGRWPSIPN